MKCKKTENRVSVSYRYFEWPNIHAWSPKERKTMGIDKIAEEITNQKISK